MGFQPRIPKHWFPQSFFSPVALLYIFPGTPYFSRATALVICISLLIVTPCIEIFLIESFRALRTVLGSAQFPICIDSIFVYILILLHHLHE